MSSDRDFRHDKAPAGLGYAQAPEQVGVVCTGPVESWKLEELDLFSIEHNAPLFPSANDQYVVAKMTACPFCKAKAGFDCTGSAVFPQYPHTLRIAAAVGVSEQEWLSMDVGRATQLIAERLVLP